MLLWIWKTSIVYKRAHKCRDETFFFFFLRRCSREVPAEPAARPPINLSLSSAAAATNYGTYQRVCETLKNGKKKRFRCQIRRGAAKEVSAPGAQIKVRLSEEM